MARADLFDTPHRAGGLAGKTVVVSPGHGIHNTGSGFGWQRGTTPTSFADANRVREDIHTNEIAILFLQRYLSNAGAVVFSCRERSFQTHERIADDGGAGYSETGAWSSSTSHPDYYGSGYRFASVSPVETAVARFSLSLPADGEYPVYVWYTPSPNRSQDALYRVRHAGGVTEVRVDQRAYQPVWYYLGSYYFRASQAAVVELSNQGQTAQSFVIADAVRIGGGVGPSGLPRWMEAARSYLPHLGYPGSATNDVTIRPQFASWIAGDAHLQGQWRNDFRFVSVHTNAGSGTGRGTMTISYTNGRTPSWSGYGEGTAHYLPGLQSASDAFRNVCHDEVLKELRAAYGTWPTAGPSSGLILLNLGELREARAMPSMLTELAFHDSPADVAYLRDEAFRHHCARGLYKAIARSFDPQATLIPLPPSAVSIENQGGGRLRVSWRAVTDPVDGARAAPTAFKVYLSGDGLGFDNGRVVQGGQTGQLDLGTFAIGQTVYARVAALNAGGESLPTKVVGARAGVGVGDVLIVNGFTRPFTHSYQNVLERYPQDLVRVHGDAFARATGLSFDAADAEAVESGRVPLDRYRMVDWFTGQESTQHETLSDGEQTLVAGYLGARGNLLLSGSEIGWDLWERGSAADRAFYRDWLAAEYVRDDSGSMSALGAGGASALGGLAAAAFHGGAHGSYAVRFPDLIEPATGSGARRALVYANGAGGAAIEVERAYRLVYLGFPLEGLREASAREAVVAASAGFLLAGQTPGPGGGGGSVTPGGSAGQVASSGGGGGGGCAFDPHARGGPGALAVLLLALAVLGRFALRRKRTTGPQY